MPDPELESRTSALRRLAEQAGRLSLEYFQRPALRVESKGDASPVTEADRECEAFLRRSIRAEFPGDGLLGEEHGHEPGTSGWEWVIDPIDGTVSFANGVPLFGVLVAVERIDEGRRRVVAGACELPAMRERVWAARGHGAWWEREGQAAVPARVTEPRPLAQALVGTTGIEYFRRAGTERVLDVLHARAGRVRGWSDCYALALAATGRCDAVVEPWMNPWDSGPFPVIFEEAGGAFSAWDGTEGIHGRTAVAAHPSLHAELLAMIAQAQGGAVS